MGYVSQHDFLEIKLAAFRVELMKSASSCLGVWLNQPPCWTPQSSPTTEPIHSAWKPSSPWMGRLIHSHRQHTVPCTALTAGKLPVVSAVQGDCERVYGQGRSSGRAIDHQYPDPLTPLATHHPFWPWQVRIGTRSRVGHARLILEG